MARITANEPRPTPRETVREHPLKLTALVYLTEAVMLEQYEQCREIIEVAREFGARSDEIDRILHSSLQLAGERSAAPKASKKFWP